MQNSSKKNILIISFYYPPNPAIGARRISKMSKELYKRGWIPHIITARYHGKGDKSKIEIPKENIHYVEWFDFKNFRMNLRSKCVFGKFLAQIFGFIPTRIFQNKFPDIDFYFWRKKSIITIEKILNDQNIDILYSSYTPISSVIIANRIAKKYNIPWINEYRDLWTNNPYEENNVFVKEINKYFEKKYIANTSVLITVSEPLKNDLIDLHHKPTEVIYNGFDKLDENIKVKHDGYFRILYTGALYLGKRDPTPLFKALEILKKENYKYFHQIRVEFYGANNIEILDEMIQSFNLQENVFCYPAVNHRIVIEKQREANLLLLLGWNNIKDSGVVTGKLFEYIERQKKILAIVYPKGVINDILIETKIGKVIVEDNKIADFLKNEIELIFDKNKEFTSDEKLLHFYSRSKQVSNLVNIFNNLLQES